YYWGAHGVQRDHVAAAHYWRQAAQAGHGNAQVAYAGMILRGEVAGANATDAVRYYEAAVVANNSRGLNGLGYMYYFGRHGLPVNRSLAFSLFERAASMAVDGDSLANAATCLHEGEGTQRNLTRAVEFYEKASTDWGHFDSIHNLGRMHAHGQYPAPVPVHARETQPLDATESRSGQDVAATTQDTGGEDTNQANDAPPQGVAAHNAHTDLGVANSRGVVTNAVDWNAVTDHRNAGMALEYLQLAAAQGPWTAIVRAAFDRYLVRDYDGAYMLYMRAWLLGFDAAGTNAAYLLRRAAVTSVPCAPTLQSHGWNTSRTMKLVQRQLLHASLHAGDVDAGVLLADAYLEEAVAAHPQRQRYASTAIALYARASQAGRASASFAMGALFEEGRDVPRDLSRSLAYYVRAASQVPHESLTAPIHLAMARVRARQAIAYAMPHGTSLDEAVRMLAQSLRAAAWLQVLGVLVLSSATVACIAWCRWNCAAILHARA
ncbi:sel1 repeat family protein, partial [archaeon]